MAAMANFDPADIEDFLERYHSRTYGCSQESYPDYCAQEPRRAPPWAPSVTGHDLLDEAEYSHYADDPRYGYSPDDDHDHDHDDAQSAYTTASTVTTTRSGTNQSAPSIFSTRTYSTTRSTVPSLRSNNNHPNHHHLPFHQQFAHNTTPSARPDQILWCEFSPFTTCTATFSLADEAGWIAHHAQHLRETFPAQLMCWFCDHVLSVDVRGADGGGGGGGYANFVERMQHVRGHIMEDHRLGAGQMRRDFHVVEHVWARGGLSVEGYRKAMAYDETPEAFRLPGTTTTGGRRGEEREARWVEEGERERERAQYYNLEKERRRAERRSRGAGTGRR